MLKELADIKQFAGEPRRRWFADEYFDLVVWQDASKEIVEFELSYDKSKNQRAIRWGKPVGYAHYRVDDGDWPGKHKASPVLLPDGYFDFGKIARLFARESKTIEKKIAKFVYEKILQFAVYPGDSENPNTEKKKDNKNAEC